MKAAGACGWPRSEEHTSELQSHHDLVCRLLLEKKKNIIASIYFDKKNKKKKKNQIIFLLLLLYLIIFYFFILFFFFFFFFNDTATTEIYTLSLHDALPILVGLRPALAGHGPGRTATDA